MARIEALIKEAIARGARKHARKLADPLRRDIRRLRQVVRQLRQDVTALREAALRWQAVVPAGAWHADVSEDEARAARLSPGLVRKLRARLGLSQAALGRLVGVSGAAVVNWEQGRSAPSGQKRRVLVALRRRGRREVRRLLAELEGPGRPARRRPPAAGAPARRGRRARPAARRRRAPARGARRPTRARPAA